MPMRIHLVILTLLLCLGFSLSAQEEQGEFCAVPPHDQLCSIFPEDVPEFSEFFEYMVISDSAQAPFDRHAWQAFVALNWSEVAQSPGSRGWRAFMRRDTVLGHDHTGHCADQVVPTETIAAGLEQSDGNMLVDRHGNYILYETRLNPVAVDYIWDFNLHQHAGQEATKIDFPRGRNAKNPASVLLKTSWTVLDAPSDDYVTAEGNVSVPANRTLSGAPLCLELTLGLVGMHIVTKVQSGNGEEWIWATFEHRANAPTAANARDINAIYGIDLFPQGCKAPVGLAEDLLLFDASHQRSVNTPPQSDALWASTPPFAVDPSGAPLPASQAVRCWKIFGPTQATNARWQAALRDTPLAQYQLISSQWRGANISPYLEHGELPRFLSNVTMETYLQTDREGTCLGCHAGATTAWGAPSDFTFVLRDVGE